MMEKIILLNNAASKNQHSAYAKTKTQVSCAVTAQLIDVYVFATHIVQSLFYLNPKFHMNINLVLT